MTKLDEKEIIGIFANELGISNLDDVALLDNGIVIKSDMLVASTDVPPGMEAWQVARKSVVSCISDLAAKGVKPYAAVISLGIPNSYSTQRSKIEGLAKGFAIASKEFAVKIVGGDTNEAGELVIDCEHDWISCIQNSNKKWSYSWRLCHRIRRIWICSSRPSNPAASKK